MLSLIIAINGSWGEKFFKELYVIAEFKIVRIIYFKYSFINDSLYSATRAKAKCKAWYKPYPLLALLKLAVYTASGFGNQGFCNCFLTIHLSHLLKLINNFWIKFVFVNPFDFVRVFSDWGIFVGVEPYFRGEDDFYRLSFLTNL